MKVFLGGKVKHEGFNLGKVKLEGFNVEDSLWAGSHLVLFLGEIRILA